MTPAYAMHLYALEADPVYIALQTEMIALQRAITDQRRRLLLIFEGRDTAGKGGAIMRFVRYMNPRHYRIVALSKPSEIEAGQWYFQRYLRELPDPGEIVFFDRSWYNRAVVEPVMGFCSPDQYETFLRQVISLEGMLCEDGLTIVKFWFSISVEEQQRRLVERERNPLKHWKLSTVDAQAQARWNEFTRYKEAMFAATASEVAPWVVIKGDDVNQARFEAMRYVLNLLDYPEKGSTGERLTPDKTIVSVLGGRQHLAM
ncbi:MAG: polyphosphate kinase 2 [Burkholderiaceae bacterium]